MVLLLKQALIYHTDAFILSRQINYKIAKMPICICLYLQYFTEREPTIARWHFASEFPLGMSYYGWMLVLVLLMSWTINTKMHREDEVAVKSSSTPNHFTWQSPFYAYLDLRCRYW